LVVKGEREK
jgi:hypothetical protein